MATTFEICSTEADMLAVNALQIQILTAAGLNPTPLDLLQRQFDEGKIIIGKKNDVLIGYLIFYVRFSEVTHMSIGVDPNAQLTGAATGLSDLMLQEFTNRGIISVTTYALASNTAACNFTVSRGYVFVEQITAQGHVFNKYTKVL
jgi:ribosomal protein S18 acetylase RimI-like enzyme